MISVLDEAKEEFAVVVELRMRRQKRRCWWVIGSSAAGHGGERKRERLGFAMMDEGFGQGTDRKSVV